MNCRGARPDPVSRLRDYRWLPRNCPHTIPRRCHRDARSARWKNTKRISAWALRSGLRLFLQGSGACPEPVEGLRMTAFGNRRFKKALRAFVFLSAVVAATWLALPKPQLLDGISFSQCVRDRNGKLLRVTLTSDQKFRIRTPLRDISPELIDATLRYEDKYFAHHPG
jgi:hypothetical protein